jgi:hypothetical protein
LRPWQYALLWAVLACNFVWRVWGLGSTPFTVDEAETGMNALTILEHGVPVDHYLGQPIFENTLLQPWPESREYEFKDSSYSSRGLAVYHGWLPLYATAASFALAGVRPDNDPAAVRVRHTAEEMRWRTVAGRVPAVLFGTAFLAAAFAAARALYGLDAAWAALAAGSVCKPVVYFTGQARYYSAALALTAGCLLLAHLMLRHGRWRDFLAGAVLFVLLFHTHLLSFVAACATFGLIALWGAWRPGVPLKLLSFAGVVAAGVLPWVALTGFAASARGVPMAHTLLGWDAVPGLLRVLGPFTIPAAVTLAWIAADPWLRGKVPARYLDPFAGHRKVFRFLGAWAAVGLFTFIAGAPAVSFFYGRLVLTILVPGFLFGALLCAAGARVVAPRFPSLVAPALFVAVVVLSGQGTLAGRTTYAAPLPYFDVIEHLRGIDFAPGTRIYATPNHHLVLTFYTGLPVQSVAPVRKSYLDCYGGELLIIEAGPRFEPLTGAEIRQVLSADGVPFTDDEIAGLEQLLVTRLLREELSGRVAAVTPGLEPAPPGLDALLTYQRRKTADAVWRRLEREGNPMFKGFRLPDHGAYWQVFYYRFVDPESRTGKQLTYAGRIRDAHVTVLPEGWVFFQCPARNEPCP